MTDIGLGITTHTTYDEFLQIMFDRGLWRRREIYLSPEEYVIVREKFTRADDHGKDHRGEMCWHVTIFRPKDGSE